MLIDLQVKRWFTQLVCSYRLCWISVVRANSWCSIFRLLYYPLSHMAYRNSTRSFSSRGDEFCDWKSAVHGRQKAELDNQGLSCPGIVQIPQLPRTSAIFYFVVIRQCIRRRGIGKWQTKIKKKHQWNDFRRRSKIGRYRSLFSQNLALYWHRTCYGILNELSDRIKMSRTHLKRIV